MVIALSDTSTALFIVPLSKNAFNKMLNLFELFFLKLSVKWVMFVDLLIFSKISTLLSLCQLFNSRAKASDKLSLLPVPTIK